MGLALVASSVACDGALEATTGPPNVILITLDALRADHLGSYGYARPTSPHIDELSSKATHYSRALASAPWTLPTHASLFTGLDPFEHGSHTYGVPAGSRRLKPLDPELLTLAEVFELEGYATGAYVTNTGFLTKRWQLDQGFQTYEVNRVNADALNRAALAWLDRHGGERFFLFLNYTDTHRPYNTSKPAPFLDEPAVRDDGELIEELYDRVMPGVGEVPAGLVQQVTDQYDTSIWLVDQQIGALVEALKERGLYDDTMIVLTSDHGEFIGEHHLVEHSKDVYQEAIAIPLVIKNPAQRKGEVVDVPTTSTDIPGLILSQCGELGARYLARFRDAPGNHEVIVENYYSRYRDVFHKEWGHRFDRVRTAIYDWPYKYIHSSDENHELYNLEDDPGEANNLALAQPDTASMLSKRLKELQRDSEPSTPNFDQPPLTKEELEQLNALGYVGD